MSCHDLDEVTPSLSGAVVGASIQAVHSVHIFVHSVISIVAVTVCCPIPLLFPINCSYLSL